MLIIDGLTLNVLCTFYVNHKCEFLLDIHDVVLIVVRTPIQQVAVTHLEHISELVSVKGGKTQTGEECGCRAAGTESMNSQLI